MEYEVSSLGKNKKNEINRSTNQTDASDEECEESLSTTNILIFKNEHPGYKYVGLKKMKRFKVPIIYSKAFCDIDDLSLNEEDYNVTANVKSLREEYARKALLLFLPFRKKDDLIDKEDMTYWSRFMDAKRKGELFYKADNILQNIQDRHNCNKIKKSGDWLEENTELIEEKK